MGTRKIQPQPKEVLNITVKGFTYAQLIGKDSELILQPYQQDTLKADNLIVNLITENPLDSNDKSGELAFYVGCKVRKFRKAHNLKPASIFVKSDIDPKRYNGCDIESISFDTFKVLRQNLCLSFTGIRPNQRYHLTKDNAKSKKYLDSECVIKTITTDSGLLKYKALVNSCAHGQGKNHFLRTLADLGYKLLVVVPRSSLEENNASDLNLNRPDDVDYASSILTQHGKNGYVCCINSLKKDGNKKSNVDPDSLQLESLANNFKFILVLDEFTQMFREVLNPKGSTIRLNDKATILRNIGKLASFASLTVLNDADANDACVEYFHNIASVYGVPDLNAPSKQNTFYITSELPKQRNMTIFTDKDIALDYALSNHIDGVKQYISTSAKIPGKLDSKNKDGVANSIVKYSTIALEAVFNAVALESSSKSSIIRIDADTKEQIESAYNSGKYANESSRIVDKVNSHTLTVATQTLDTGFSIPSDKVECDLVGHFSGGTQSINSVTQAIERIRFDCDRFMYLPETSPNRHTEWGGSVNLQAIKRNLAAKLNLNNSKQRSKEYKQISELYGWAVDPDTDSITVNPHHESFLIQCIQFKVACNHHYRDVIVLRSLSRGYSIYVDETQTTKEITETLNTVYKQIVTPIILDTAQKKTDSNVSNKFMPLDPVKNTEDYKELEKYRDSDQKLTDDTIAYRDNAIIKLKLGLSRPITLIDVEAYENKAYVYYRREFYLRNLETAKRLSFLKTLNTKKHELDLPDRNFHKQGLDKATKIAEYISTIYDALDAAANQTVLHRLHKLVIDTTDAFIENAEVLAPLFDKPAKAFKISEDGSNLTGLRTNIYQMLMEWFGYTKAKSLKKREYIDGVQVRLFSYQDKLPLNRLEVFQNYKINDDYIYIKTLKQDALDEQSARLDTTTGLTYAQKILNHLEQEFDTETLKEAYERMDTDIDNNDRETKARNIVSQTLHAIKIGDANLLPELPLLEDEVTELTESLTSRYHNTLGDIDYDHLGNILNAMKTQAYKDNQAIVELAKHYPMPERYTHTHYTIDEEIPF